MKLKPGKYLGHKFTPEQKKARAMHRRAQEQEVRLIDALMLSGFRPRKEMHTRLDERLDVIERLNSKAEALFPDVVESFIISSGTISFTKRGGV